MRNERIQPGIQRKRLAQRACHLSQRLGMDTDRGGEHGHVAGQRLEHSQAEPLALRGHEHGVGGVDPVGDACGRNRSERAQLDIGGAGKREGAIVALLWAVGGGGEQDERRLRIEAQLGSGLGAGDRAKALEIHATRQDLNAGHTSAAGWRVGGVSVIVGGVSVILGVSVRRRVAGVSPNAEAATEQAVRRQAGELIGQRLGCGGEDVHARGDHPGERTRARVADIGSVHGQRSDPRRNGKRRPGGQAEVGVYDVHPFFAVTAAQLRRAANQRAWAGSELVQLNLDSAVQSAQRRHLVAHELAALRMSGVGQHVRDDQRAHALTVAPVAEVAVE